MASSGSPTITIGSPTSIPTPTTTPTTAVTTPSTTTTPRTTIPVTPPTIIPPTTRPPPSTTTPDPTTQDSITTVFTTTFITTDGSGQSYTTISEQPSVIPNNASNTPHSDLPVAPIVGGVIGGVGGLLLLGLIWWLWKSKRKNDQFEDGMFDPDKNIQRPANGGGNNWDLAADDVGASRVTPFVFAGAGGADHGGGPGRQTHLQPEMSIRHGGQYPNSYPTGPPAESDYSYPSYHSSSIPQQPYHAAPAVGLQRGGTTASGSSSGYPSSPYPGDTNTLSPASSGGSHLPLLSPPPGAAAPSGIPGISAVRAAKEREAFSRSPQGGGAGGLTLSNPTTSSPTNEHSPAPVIVHQDGGRVPELPQDTEIPPTYDSIPNQR